jgi:hypothetical protein
MSPPLDFLFPQIEKERGYHSIVFASTYKSVIVGDELFSFIRICYHVNRERNYGSIQFYVSFVVFLCVK